MKTTYTLLLMALITIVHYTSVAQCPSTLTVNVSSVTHANCPDNGTVVLGGTGVGNAAVTYKIISGASQVGLEQNSNVFNSLSAGTYLFRATCSGQTAEVTAVIDNNYNPINPSFIATVNNSCNNYTTGGIINLTGVSGGSAPLQYSFIKEAQANYDDALSVYSSNDFFNATDNGIYQVRIKDACGVFVTKSIQIKPSYSAATFGDANVSFDNVSCDSAGLNFWMYNDDNEGVILSDYSKLKFAVYESINCMPGNLIKTFELIDSSNAYFIIPKKDVIVEITTPCGEVRRKCYDYPEEDSLQSFWVPLVEGCGTGSNPYTFSIKHQYNNYCHPPYTVNFYNNTTNTLISSKTYTSNWQADVYSNLPFDNYRLETTDACGNSDTLIVNAPSGAVSILPVNAGSITDYDCTLQNGKLTLKLKLTGLITNLTTATLTIISGPDNIGQSAVQNSMGLYRFANLTPGATYIFQLNTGCTITDLSFKVPDDTWRIVKFTLAPTVLQQCGGLGDLQANVQYNSWGSFRTELWNGSTIVAQNNSGNYTNVAPGLYKIKAIAEQLSCSGIKYFTLEDTVRVFDDNEPPVIQRQFGYACDGSANPLSGRANINVAGFGPFKYEIKKTAPSVDSAYTVVSNAAPGNYSIDNLEPNAIYNLLITDNCGKSTITQIYIGSIGSLAFENAYNPCINNPYLLSAPDIAGAVYEWRKKNDATVLSTTRDIYFGDYNAAYDGEYNCLVTLGNGCMQRTLTADISSLRCNAILPVNFTKLSVKNNNCAAQLYWSTSHISGYFEIEQSTDGINFIKAAAIPATDVQTNLNSNFTYTTNILLQAKYYFRIKAVETSGKKTYSPVLTMNNNCNKLTAGIAVFPNPAINDVLHVQLLLTQDVITGMMIYSQTGSLVKNINLQAGSGKNNISIMVSNLSAGIYFLKVTNNKGFSEVVKFIKK
jgi:Secretion system C-terminal sorting domain